MLFWVNYLTAQKQPAVVTEVHFSKKKTQLVRDDQIFLRSFVAAANWTDWKQRKVRPSNSAVDPSLRSVRRSPSCHQSASLKPDMIRLCVFVMATSQSCRKQTNSAEQNKRTFFIFFLASLCTLTSLLIKAREDIPRCPEFQLVARKHHLFNISPLWTHQMLTDVPEGWDGSDVGMNVGSLLLLWEQEVKPASQSWRVIKLWSPFHSQASPSTSGWGRLLAPFGTWI